MKEVPWKSAAAHGCSASTVQSSSLKINYEWTLIKGRGEAISRVVCEWNMHVADVSSVNGGSSCGFHQRGAGNQQLVLQTFQMCDALFIRFYLNQSILSGYKTTNLKCLHYTRETAPSLRFNLNLNFLYFDPCIPQWCICGTNIIRTYLVN